MQVKTKTHSPRQKRIQRAEELAREHPSMAQILTFYAELCRFQDELYAHFADRKIAPSASGSLDLPALLP